MMRKTDVITLSLVITDIRQGNVKRSFAANGDLLAF